MSGFMASTGSATDQVKVKGKGMGKAIVTGMGVAETIKTIQLKYVVTWRQIVSFYVCPFSQGH